MILKDIAWETPEENIVYDEVLLRYAEEQGGIEFMRFWEASQYFIVLGRVGQKQEDVHVARVEADQIPVVRRSSGGGTVLQGKGCWNYSLILSKKTRPEVSDLKKSYAYILHKVINVLKQMGMEAAYFPVSDIALLSDRKKVSGNAQKRSRACILHHGTLLYNFDISQIERYLKIPANMPEYRRQRPHADFVTNLPIADTSVLEACFREIFGVDTVERTLACRENELLKDLLGRGKYRG